MEAVHGAASADDSASALRLGLVWPGGGAEHEYYQFAESLDDRIKIFLAASRVGGEDGKDHEVEAIRITAQIERVEEAARRLVVMRPDVVYWACTCGSFIDGRAFAEKQVGALETLAGVPAGSTSLGFADALDTLGIERVSVLATYPEPVSRAFVAFLEEFGVEVVNLRWMGAMSGWDAALIDSERVLAEARSAMVPRAQALLVPDTAMPTLDLVERMEAATGSTVLSANAVSLWHAMDLAGRPMPSRGRGRLLRTMPGGTNSRTRKR